MDEELHAYLSEGANPFDLGDVISPKTAVYDGVVSTPSKVVGVTSQALPSSQTIGRKTASVPSTSTSGSTSSSSRPAMSHRESAPAPTPPPSSTSSDTRVFVPDIVIGPPPETAVPAGQGPSRNGFEPSAPPPTYYVEPTKRSGGGAMPVVLGGGLLLLILMLSWEKGSR